MTFQSHRLSGGVARGCRLRGRPPASLVWPARSAKGHNSIPEKCHSFLPERAPAMRVWLSCGAAHGQRDDRLQGMCRAVPHNLLKLRNTSFESTVSFGLRIFRCNIFSVLVFPDFESSVFALNTPVGVCSCPVFAVIHKQ